MTPSIEISTLIQLDNSTALNVLSDAVGDAYLYERNWAFARTRDLSSELGYSFSTRETALWRDYLSLPLLTLNRLITERTIPYFDNGSALRRLIENNPSAKLPIAFVTSTIRHNHVFHESAHCVGHSVLDHHKNIFNKVGFNDKEHFVLASLLCESLANTMETLAAASEPSIAHIVFLALNSYMIAVPKQKEVLDSATAALGESMVFRLLFLAYCESNLTISKPSERTYERIATCSDGGHIDRSLLEQLVDIGFRLDRGFRSLTTPAYFGLLDCGQEFIRMSCPEWLELDSAQSVLRSAADLLANIILN
jgi:hypothetical protein